MVPRQSTRMQTPGAARRTHTTLVEGASRPPNKLFGLEAPETQAPRRGHLACSHQQNPEKMNLPPGPVPASRTGPVGPEPSVDAPLMPGVQDGAAGCLGSSWEPGCSHFGRQSPPPGPEAHEPRAGAGTTAGAGPAHADVPGVGGSRGGRVRAPARRPPVQQPPSEAGTLGPAAVLAPKAGSAGAPARPMGPGQLARHLPGLHPHVPGHPAPPAPCLALNDPRIPPPLPGQRPGTRQASTRSSPRGRRAPRWGGC